MLGLDKLKISLTWRFRRTSPGSHSDSMPGEILCDLGGKLTTGVIDPHDSPHLSATDAIWAKPHLVLNHLLGPLNKTRQAGIEIERKEIEFTFVAGRPHWDGLCAFVLCDHLVRTGDSPPWARELVESANKVDHGEARMHSMKRLPVLTAGSGGGRMKTGYHVAAEGDAATRVGFTVQQAFGVARGSWGTESNRVSSPFSEVLTSRG